MNRLYTFVVAIAASQILFAVPDSYDLRRNALASSIVARVSAAVPNYARRKVAFANPLDLQSKLAEEKSWQEVWPADEESKRTAKNLVTNAVTAKVWTRAIQAALDSKGAVFIPKGVYYIDEPIVLSSHQTLVAARDAELRMVPKVNMCMVRNASVVGMDKNTLAVPADGYDNDIYIEGGVWTTLKTTRRTTNGNVSGVPRRKNPVHGCYGAIVLNHVKGIQVRDITVKECNMHALQLSDVMDFLIDGVDFIDQGRDGVHVHGGCERGVIRNIRGVTYDDFVALNAWDWANTSPVVGPIRDVLVEKVTGNYFPKSHKSEGTAQIRLQPGNRKRKDGTTCECPIENVVLRELKNIRTIKMYDQPNLEMGRNNDYSDPLGIFRNVFISDLLLQRPCSIEVDDNVDGLDIANIRYDYTPAQNEKLVFIEPKSGTYGSGNDPSKWVEIYSPDKDITVQNFTLRNVWTGSGSNSSLNSADDFYVVRDGKLNPNYPKTKPRGGTGKVKFIPVAATGDYNMPDEVASTMDADAVMKLMETPAAANVFEQYPFALFGEERSRAVRRGIAPAHWFDGTELARMKEFKGVAQPGEFYAFQVCVMSRTARELKWCIEGGECITSNECKVAACKVKPLWTMVKVPQDAVGKTLRGKVIVKDKFSGEERSIDWQLQVKGAVLKDGGVSDASRLSRLAWLQSDVGKSETEPTRPFTAITIDKTRRALKILGREIVLAPNGLPAQYRTWFNGSVTRLSNVANDLLASPVSFGTVNEPKFSWLKSTPCCAQWQSEWSTDGVTWKLVGSLEFDGYMQFEITATGADGVTLKPELAFTLNKDLARYQMGLGRRGGEWPQSTFTWQWQQGLHQDAVWFGDVAAGMMLRLRDKVRTRPLINCYHKWKPLQLPECWKRGGVIIDRDSIKVTDGEVVLQKGKTANWNFELFLTPFKPADLAAHLADRYIHLGQRSKSAWCSQYVKEGATVMNLHHNTVWNPYINYPYNDDGAPLLKEVINTAHSHGLRTKIYYTTREITQNLPEFFALASLDGEVFQQRDETVKGWPMTNAKGPHPWLREHVGEDVLPAWRETVSFTNKYPAKLDLAVITNPDSQRWNNFYLAGLEYLVKQFGIDGLYIDDTALDRKSMQRARRILDADGSTARRVDMHSWSHFNKTAGMLPSDICFMELYPYYDRLWHGEGFRADVGSPEFWLIERSGLCWGVLGEQLGKGNPWKGMLFAQTDRWGWGGSPQQLWRFFDEVRLGEAELFGFWQKDVPVKLEGATNCRATVYVIPASKTDRARMVVAIANFAKELEQVKVVCAHNGKRVFVPTIKGLQDAQPLDLSKPLEIKGEGGIIFIVE